MMHVKACQKNTNFNFLAEVQIVLTMIELFFWLSALGKFCKYS